MGKAASDTEFILSTYEDVAPYLVSNYSAMPSTAWLVATGVTGSPVMGEEYLEVYADEEVLDRTDPAAVRKSPV